MTTAWREGSTQADGEIQDTPSACLIRYRTILRWRSLIQQTNLRPGVAGGGSGREAGAAGGSGTRGASAQGHRLSIGDGSIGHRHQPSLEYTWVQLPVIVIAVVLSVKWSPCLNTKRTPKTEVLQVTSDWYTTN